MKIRNLLLLLILGHMALSSMSQSLSYDIRLNQVGYLPNSIKQAAIINTESDSFQIINSSDNSVVFKGQCLPAVYYSSSDENVRIADFTLLTAPGDYVLVVDDLGKSLPFSISEDVFISLSKASIKAFFFNRASMEIQSAYGGIYARKEGHPDTSVIVLPSAASAARPEGTIISTPGGWYDAGDYNKYIVNSGISVFTLLSAYETYPEYFDTLNLSIPESDNQIPDILDEALWNIKWMMTMQDTVDGGVYHKTTEASFSSFVMPDKVTAKRYVTAKSTAATLDFAAIMAMTARIIKPYDPQLANQALKQAIKAWQWAQNNPQKAFTNPSASGSYPAVSTGEYGDSNFDDEFLWSAAELYITTKDLSYYNKINLTQAFDIPGWGNVKTLGLLSLLVNKESLTAEADTTLVKTKLLNLIEDAKNNIITSPYRIPGDYYYWGGNNAYANLGMLFMQAFKLTHNAGYFNAALSTLDYLLGKNATKYCFVTGSGTKRPMNIHHRISGSDGIAEPVPGFLVGGPNPGNVTDCGSSSYPSLLPAKSYLDQQCSYSTNEIAINWNAPLAFLTGAVQCEYLANFTDSMPGYFSVSASNITLPYKAGTKYQVVIEGNTQWSLNSSADWIGISQQSGTSSTVVDVYSKTDNTGSAVREGKIYVYNSDLLIDSINVQQKGISKTFRIEAEDYSGMLGLQTETTTDTGGGLNLGYVDPGDWATYNLDVSFSGIYDVTFRHAGYAGNFDVSIDDNFLQNVAFAATSGWQDWVSYTSQMTLIKGEHVMKLDFKAAGINLNWMDFNWVSEVNIYLKENNDQIYVYPNPASRYLNIEFTSAGNQATIQLVSMDGKILINHVCQGSVKEQIDISDMTKGMYLLKLNFNSNVYTKKIIIN
jgi:endoglucanase